MPKAKKKSADPIQQALRDHKAEWKDAQKEFVAHVMGLKNGLNGRGDSRFGIPPSNIKDPLPGEISALLGALTSQFQTLVGGAGSIIAEQNSYSQNRRKKQEQKLEQKKPEISAPQANQSAPGGAKPPIAKDTAVDNFLSNVASTEVGLEKYGSRMPSRVLQYMLAMNPWSKDKDIQKRAGLLRQTAEIYHAFLDLENSILSLGIDSIPTATYQYQAIHDNLKILKRTLVDEDPVGDKPAGDKPSETDGSTSSDSTHDGGEDLSDNNPKPSGPDKSKLQDMINNPRPAASKHQLPPQKQLAAVLQGIHNELTIIYRSSLPLQKECLKITKLILQFGNAQSSNDNELAYDLHNQINNEYRTLKMVLSTLVEQEKDPVKKEQLKKLVVASDLSVDEIIKISHNFVTRRLKKEWVKLRPSNKTAAPRLIIVHRIETIKKELQKMMDSLEKKIETEALLKSISILMTESSKIQKTLSTLNLMYRQQAYKEYSKRKKNKDTSSNPFMDTMLQNEFRRDLRKIF